jgi:hypothetical protein
MHTSATPGTNDGVTNPNPVVGYAMIQFKQNFNKYLGGFFGIIPPLASSNLTSVTNHNPYVITSLGSTTLAQWQAVGLTQGITPAVGVSFIATATASFGGSGTVGAPGVPALAEMSVVGDPNQSISNSSIAANGGAILIVSLLAPTNSSTTTLAPAAPADGSVIGMEFSFDMSSVTIDGL